MPQGWVNLLLDRRVRSLDIVNRGFSGYNTRWLLEHIDELKPDFANANVVTVLLGANDSCKQPGQHVPIEQFSLYLRQIIDCIQQSGSASIVLIETPWVDGKAWGDFAEEDADDLSRSAQQAEQYARAVRHIAQERNLRLIGLFDKMADQPELLCDGLHLSDAGNKLLADLVEQELNELLGDAEKCVQLPDWKEKK